MGTFSYGDEKFYLNGEPIQILSGSIHYFRVVPEYWRDRMEKLKQCGFNAVETYICWNLHERKEGQFDFTGGLDLGKFIDIANELGLLCIIRPGPYICAEWDYGGLPSWLLTHRDMRIRCMDEKFLEKETRYLDKVFEIIRPRLITNGGNIIMVQVENEYGSFGNDHEYIDFLADYYKKSGIDVPLFTSDGPSDFFFGGGTRKGILATGNFGSGGVEYMNFIKNYYPGNPTMCAEFWEGWFDNWYLPHHRREPDDVAQLVDEMLSIGGSVNFYMFCGGTNFGFNNGANIYDEKDENGNPVEVYAPTITSYDYDAALTEAGDLTKRFFEVRAVAEKHFGKLPELTVKDTPKKAYGKVTLNESASLMKNLDNISYPVKSSYTKTMEELGVDFGFMLYSTTVDYPVEGELFIDPLRDRAVVYVNGEYKGVKERSRRNDTIKISNKRGEVCKIDILVENMGRVNYGVKMWDNEKGILRGARIGQQQMFGWTMYPLTMEDLSKLEFNGAPVLNGEDPMFLRGNLVVEGTPCDTFVRLDNFHKGIIKVNGFNLGRYFTDAGPQKTLYVPAPTLKEGNNEILVFEVHGCSNNEIEFCDTPDLG